MRATREGKAHLGRPNEREDMGLLGEEGCLKRLGYLLLCTHASQERRSDGPIENLTPLCNGMNGSQQLFKTSAPCLSMNHYLF